MDDGAPTALTVVVGSDEFLVSRAVRRLTEQVRAADPHAEVTDIEAAAFDDSAALVLASPGLFGGRRVLVLRSVQDVSEEGRAALIAYATDPLDDLCLVAVHSGGVKARKLPDELGAAGATVLRCSPLTRPAERLQFVQDEIRAAGGQSTAGAVRALVEAVGTDLRELSAAAAQLVADTAGPLDESAVARFHRGRAETSGFAVADAALSGQAAEALALLRSALETGTAPVLLSSALASGLRDVARVRDAGSGPVAAVARELGMPPWKVDKALRVARGWADDSLAAAITAVAAADAGVKGAAVDGAYALQRAVLSVVSARGGGSGRPGRRG